MNPWVRRAVVSFVVPFAVRKFQERRAGQAPVQPASRRSQLMSGAAGRMPARRVR
jgi:hypothetical protein